MVVLKTQFKQLRKTGGPKGAVCRMQLRVPYSHARMGL